MHPHPNPDFPVRRPFGRRRAGSASGPFSASVGAFALRGVVRALEPVLVVLLAAGSFGCYCTAPLAERDFESRVVVVPGAGDYAWSADRGWVKPRQGDWGTPDQVRSESGKAFKAQAWLEALEGYQALQKKLLAADATQAQVQFQIAECYYAMGNYPDAVEAYRTVYKKGRPDETTLNQSFSRVHEIALEYIHEKAYCAFAFDWFVYRGFSYGSDLLLGTDGLITEYPYLPFADDAIMEIAKVHFDDEEFAEAAMLYERVATIYRAGKWRSDAQFLSAMSTYRLIRGIDYDQQVIFDADRKFRAYLQDNPRGRQADEARAKVNELAEMLGESTLRKAKFYLHESQFPAARLYLGVVLERYTSTAAAREAREILREIERVESRS